jgi:hypothetical protein
MEVGHLLTRSKNFHSSKYLSELLSSWAVICPLLLSDCNQNLNMPIRFSKSPPLFNINFIENYFYLISKCYIRTEWQTDVEKLVTAVWQLLVINVTASLLETWQKEWKIFALCVWEESCIAWRSNTLWKDERALSLCRFLGTFTKLRKAAVSFGMLVSPSVLTEHCADIHEIWYLNIFRKSVEQGQFWNLKKIALPSMETYVHLYMIWYI